MSAKNRTLLIVDDEPETLKGYADFLAPKASDAPRKSSRRIYGTGSDPAPGAAPSEEFKLLAAASGEEAIKIVEKEMKEGRRVAAGFFDVKLGGGMDGLATIHAIKAMDPAIHCVVVTAYHDRSIDEINQLFGEDFKDQWDYLNKPFTQGEIVQKARQMTAAWNRKAEVDELHRQLVRQERLAAVGQVARGVGHEFGNILLRIMGKTDLALIEKDPAKLQEHLKTVMKAAERAGVIVRNLQSFSKNEPNFQFGNVTTPVEEALSLVNHELTKNTVKVAKEFKTVPQIRLDTGGIAQVVLNLIINAIHAMEPKGGTITIAVEPAQGEGGAAGVAVRIADTGHGIPDEVLPRIFEFAYTTKGDRGSGLGLSISKEIVEAHGGALTVKTQVGKGTEFAIWLPEPKGGK